MSKINIRPLKLSKAQERKNLLSRLNRERQDQRWAELAKKGTKYVRH